MSEIKTDSYDPEPQGPTPAWQTRMEWLREEIEQTGQRLDYYQVEPANEHRDYPVAAGQVTITTITVSKAIPAPSFAFECNISCDKAVVHMAYDIKQWVNQYRE